VLLIAEEIHGICEREVVDQDAWKSSCQARITGLSNAHFDVLKVLVLAKASRNSAAWIR